MNVKKLKFELCVYVVVGLPSYLRVSVRYITQCEQATTER